MISISNKPIIKSIAFLLCSFILCSTFTTQYAVFDNSYTIYPITLSILFGISVVFLSILFVHHTGKFRINLQDILFTIIVIYFSIRYDTDLQLANWKIDGIKVMLLLWLVVRVSISYFAQLQKTLIYSIIFAGSLQAGWGLMQLYGYVPSNHALFPITGTFYNPGPYSGYIGIVIPICLYQILSTEGIRKYILYIALFLMICIIPAGMSRSAWLGVFVSCLWVAAMKLEWKSKISISRGRNPKSFWVKTSLIMLSIVILSLLFILKKDSANGRLFIWKNTWYAIVEKPINGYGIGTFPQVYAKQQAGYFSERDYSDQEERVAGSPEYAFNDYLQCTIEGGIILLILTILLLVLTLRQGVRNKSYGTVGGIISLLIFALSSYPFQIMSFWIVGVLLMSICATPLSDQNEHIKSDWRSKIIPGIVLILSIIATKHTKSYAPIVDSWNKCRLLISHDAIIPAACGYKQLYEDFKHNPSFLFEYAQCLIKLNDYNGANVILRRAAKVSNDAMIFNLMGENYQKMKLYKKAEECYLHSIDLLPGRIYPYYLLTMLYAEPGFYYPQEMEVMRQIVLTKRPKVDSKAIQEMRKNVQPLKIRTNETQSD